MRMLKGFIEILQDVYDTHGDMPIVGENMKGDYGEIYISTVVNHEGKPTRVLLEIDEEKDYDDEEELDT